MVDGANFAAVDGAHVLLGVSGGIAAYKAAPLARDLRRAGASVQVLLTPAARQFIGAATFEGLTGRPVIHDVFDDPADISHVRMAREADVAIFAPATANLLAKFAAGIADDLVTSTFSCLVCPVILAPAMHAEMWAHPATAANVATLTERGGIVVGPDEGELAGGDVGLGRLAEPLAIMAAAAEALGPSGPLDGTRVVVTAGGTREAIDPVRFLGNRSTGRMGFAIARRAARRGAKVDLVTGPTSLATPAGVDRHDVVSARDMHAAVMARADAADVIIKAAAVADFRPRDYSGAKIKKDAGGFEQIVLERNPDILAELGHRSYDGTRPVLVGFAAETDTDETIEAMGRGKLERKGADLIVVNRVDGDDAGFATDTNKAVVLDASGGRIATELVSKDALADAILDRAGELLASRRDEKDRSTTGPPSR